MTRNIGFTPKNRNFLHGSRQLTCFTVGRIKKNNFLASLQSLINFVQGSQKLEIPRYSCVAKLGPLAVQNVSRARQPSQRIRSFQLHGITGLYGNIIMKDAEIEILTFQLRG